MVCEFVQRYPKVTAEMLFLDRVVNLVEEGVDVGIRIAHLKDSSMVAIPVGHTRRVLCASEKYLRRYGIPKSPNDLSKHIAVRHTGLVPRNEWQFRVGNRQVTVPVNSAVVCNDIDSAVNACVAGVGLGMFLSYMVAPHRKQGQLRYVLETFQGEPTPVQIIYPQSKLLSSKVRTFIDESVAKFRQLHFD
jgi:DNA-binding transcriptional LysR family regulator